MAAVITLHIPASPMPTETATLLREEVTTWSLTAEADISRLDLVRANHPLTVATVLETAGIKVNWQTTTPSCHDALFREPPVQQTYDWPIEPQILALIPHWQCEPWLERCLTSVLQQTYPLTHIAVIDDASVQPPLEIVRQFPNVTLLTAPQRVGPYRLIQSVIDATDYDAYLFQDADDWSSCDRLEQLLKTACLQRAELIGSQEIRVLESSKTFQTVGYPLDVNHALLQSLGHPLLHPTSLVTRRLVQRVGGFATGLRFGGDTEFLLRAYWLGRVVNSPHYCYFRRKRLDSLTTAPDTGLESPARRQLIQSIKQRAIARTQAAVQQEALDLSPLQSAPLINLEYCCGPRLRWHS
jgi:hypothetical protein